MIGVELPAWVVALQIFTALQNILMLYVLVFWTPIRDIVPLLPRYYLQTRKWLPLLNDGEQSPQACWQMYRLWVDIGLAWRAGEAACLARAKEDSWLLHMYEFISRTVLTGAPITVVVKSVLAFANLTNEQVDCLADYMSRKLLGGSASAEEIGEFLREEQKLLEGDSRKFFEHANRLAERFGIRPFASSGKLET